MRVVKQKDCDITEISSALLRGETIVYPTETCYGLGCYATNQAAVDKIFRIKGRREDKPLLVIVPNTKMVQEYAEWATLLSDIEQRYWPGPLTVVVTAKKDCGLADGVVAKDGTIAIRVTAHPLARGIVESLGKPLVSTSANRSGVRRKWRRSSSQRPEVP